MTDPRSTQPRRDWLDHAGPFDGEPTPPLPVEHWPAGYAVGPPRRRIRPLGWFVIVLVGGAALVLALAWLLGEHPVLVP